MDENPSIWRQVFSDTAQAVALFGALGGFTHALVFKRDWKETIRLTLIGCAASFGFGVLSYPVLRMWFPNLPEELSETLPFLTAGSFFFGLVSLFLIERLLAKIRGEDPSGGKGDDADA